MKISEQRQIEYIKAETLYKLISLETEILGIDLITYVEPTLEKHMAFLEKHTMKGVRLNNERLKKVERMLSAQL